MTVFILNPAAGRSAGRKWRRFAAGADGVVLETARPGHATVLAREAAAQGASVVAACGGDGTVNEVAHGLLGTPAALGVVPLGTGNDFARTIGVYGNLPMAMETIRLGRTSPLDLIRWRCAELTGICVNVAGCGFDAEVARRTNLGSGWLRGTSAYIYAVLGALASYKPVDLSLSLDGEALAAKAMLCAIANAKSYGGGMKIAPMANISDGILDVVLVKETAIFEFLRAFPSVFSGKHLSHPKVLTRTAQSIRIESAEPTPALVDGEIVGQLPIELEILPNALRVVTPGPA